MTVAACLPISTTQRRLSRAAPIPTHTIAIIPASMGSPAGLTGWENGDASGQREQ